MARVDALFLQDSTGAGDACAGGVMRWRAAQDDTRWPALETAIMHGSAIAGFAVERFGVHGLWEVRRDDVDRRRASLRGHSRGTGKGEYAHVDA